MARWKGAHCEPGAPASSVANVHAEGAGENLWRRLDERFRQAGRISDDVQGFGADHAQKGSPDVSAGPIVP
jgi:hypothetical protein